VNKMFFFFSAGGAQGGSPRRHPWVSAREIPSPGWGWDFFRSETHGFTVGCFRPLLRSLKSAIILLAFIFAGNIFAADVVTDFAAANKLYAEGKFADAANAYETILQGGAQSPALLFNCGNAEFKAGNLGKAIAAFRRAELLAPRDAEIRANLDFVRNQVQGATAHGSRWQNWLNALTLNEWTLLVVAAFWLTFILLAARQFRPALVPKLKTATTFFALLAIFSGVILGVQAANHFSNSTAVVTSAEATARSGPFDDAQSGFTVDDGAELSVLDRHEGWVQVADGSGKSGWLPLKQVEVLPGA
jgi:tetratricopeptide (TPR) repeat protein